MQKKAWVCASAAIVCLFLARSEAIARLRTAASSKGANALLHVEVKVTPSNMPYLNKGLTNGCLFETAANGDAAVISGSEPAPAQLGAEAFLSVHPPLPFDRSTGTVLQGPPGRWKAISVRPSPLKSPGIAVTLC